MHHDLFIYFDIGGVLLDWSKVFETATTKFDLKVGDIGAVFDEFVEQVTKGFLTPQQFWGKCIQKYNLKNADNYDFLESWVSDYQPIQEMHELIHKLKPKYNIGLLSNIYQGMLPLLKEKELIPNIHYEQIIFSCDIGEMKPNPDIFAYAQKRAGVDSNKILLVDDSENNLDAAKKVNWNTFLFNNRQREYSVKKLEDYLMHF